MSNSANKSAGYLSLVPWLVARDKILANLSQLPCPPPAPNLLKWYSIYTIFWLKEWGFHKNFNGLISDGWTSQPAWSRIMILDFNTFQCLSIILFQSSCANGSYATKKKVCNHVCLPHLMNYITQDLPKTIYKSWMSTQDINSAERAGGYCPNKWRAAMTR